MRTATLTLDDDLAQAVEEAASEEGSSIEEVLTFALQAWFLGPPADAGDDSMVAEADAGFAEIDRGEFVTHEALIQEMRDRFPGLKL